MDLKILEAVEKTGSKLEKQKLLGHLTEDSLKFMRWALDPMITFGVTVDADLKLSQWSARFDVGRPQPKTRKAWWDEFDGLCKKLSARKLTGNVAAETIEGLMLVAHEEADVIWACRILNKDLRSGFSASTLNKAHPKCIETEIPCALAKPYDPEKHEIRGAWAVEPKLDGLRMVVVNGQAYTRNGRTIDSVGHILKELEVLGHDYVWDGEIMGATNFDEDSGKIRKKGMGPNLSLRYNVFDCIWKKEWDERWTQPYGARRMYLTEALGTAAPEYVNIVPTTKFLNPTSEELFKARDKYIEMGYEGAMLKDLSSPYIFKRSDVILKLKEFTDADGRITSCFEGKGKHKHKLGGVIAKFDGVETRVGSGFSDKQRVDLWEEAYIRPENVIGKMIEVQYQNKTEDGCLRFPVFIKFRPDKD